jgi:hypothetical protein
MSFEQPPTVGVPALAGSDDRPMVVVKHWFAPLRGGVRSGRLSAVKQTGPVVLILGERTRAAIRLTGNRARWSRPGASISRRVKEIAEIGLGRGRATRSQEKQKPDAAPQVRASEKLAGRLESNRLSFGRTNKGAYRAFGTNVPSGLVGKTARVACG